MSRFEKAKNYIVSRFEKELPPFFHYHNLEHVYDVLQAAEAIGKSEGISDHDNELLKIAVLYHDSGFLVNPDSHEAISCMIVKEALPDFNYTNDEIDVICGLIMATRIPQSPKKHLEEIICDADLDYLGRDDFYTTGDKVFKELKERGKINDKNEWNKIQVKFLESHNYFTDTSRKLRRPRKLLFLEEVKEMINVNS